jgi:hypothetical protein
MYVKHERSNSGPGWAVWAQQAHADHIGAAPAVARMLTSVLVANPRSGTADLPPHELLPAPYPAHQGQTATVLNGSAATRR